MEYALVDISWKQTILDETDIRINQVGKHDFKLALHEKSLAELLLCATSVFSVPLWLTIA